MMNYPWDAIVIGCSAGGIQALKRLLSLLPETFPVPIIIVQHMGPDAGNFLASYLNKHCALMVMEAETEQQPEPGKVYLAPANYHLLIEDQCSLSLCAGEKIAYARPSIDMLFESAADVFEEKLLGIILTGANNDGTQGALKIKAKNGIIIAQDPEEAEINIMPLSVIEVGAANHVLSLANIAAFLKEPLS